MCKFFHSHFNNFSGTIKLIHKIQEGYNKAIRNKKPIWSEEVETAFKIIQEAISECAKLHFMDDKSPITLQTGASNYGMGSYLSQNVDDMESQIALISKTFDKT